MKKRMLLASTCLWAMSVFAENNPSVVLEDTTKVIDIEEVIVIASPKEHTKLRELPSAVSLLSQQDMQKHRITSLKNVSALVPNFFMPDYGSRLTSAVYIRGIGSRINTPAIGLYVDNIPYIDKSAFDFNFYDIERIDILRGPQATLYGRNTMGGLIKVHTRSPFSYQGTDVKLGYATKDNHRDISFTHYHRWSDRFAFSAGGYYEGSDGFFRNSYAGEPIASLVPPEEPDNRPPLSDKKLDAMQAGGGRIRAIWLPSENLKLDFTASYDYSDEGGYPYFNEAGKIDYNQESSYRRGLFNAGLNLQYQAEHFILNAITGYQNLNDRMFMDQDFSAYDRYTLEQKQRINTLTEEITLKSKPGKAWQWTTGVFGLYQTLHTDSPVNFGEHGIGFLNYNINQMFPDLSEMGMNMFLALEDPAIAIPSSFDTPTLSGALFHQSTFTVGKWDLTAGLRLEYEHMEMDYTSSADANFRFSISNKYMPIHLEDQKASALLEGKLKNDYTQLLPKFAAKYNFDRQNNFYVSVAKGYRSGGYNLQMFSDIAQAELQNAMKQEIKNGVNEKLTAFQQMGMPQQVIGMIQGMLGQYLAPTATDVRATTVYKPEYSWNYETGLHLTLCNGKLQADLAAFYMDTRDQQIAKFVNSGLGRITVNAGESESYGVEANFLASVNRHLKLNGSYGYTHSTFKKYDAGKNSSEGVMDYSGNYVPFVPRHTLNVGADYTFFFPRAWAQSLTVGANYSGAGKIYWTEKNDASQNFYGTLNARLSLKANDLQIDLWGRNLTNKDYTTFYFESMNQGFRQRSKPLQLGVDVRYHF